MLRRILALMFLAALGGCATTGGNPHDPLEGFNRAMFGFNEGVDKAIIKPVASGYKTVMPAVARTGVSNFFSNLADPWIGVNNILQGKVGAGVSDFGRFAINTIVGVLGLFDVASNAGLEKHNEDFGQTLGRWGMGSGAYVVLPLFGPSTVRDGVSRLFVDWHGDPVWYVRNVPTRIELIVVRTVDGRARLLDAGRLTEEAALDHYAYVRDAYLQRRRNLIYDGNPPPEPDADQSSESGDGKDAAAPAGTELPPARIVTQWGERVITAADAVLTPAMEFAGTQAPPVAPIVTQRGEQVITAAGEELTPAKEFAGAQAPPVAAGPEATGVTGSVYEPKIPSSYESVLAVSGEVRNEVAPTSLRP